MEKRILYLNKERNVTLTALLHEAESAEKLPAILVLPGGGYSVCADGEAEPPAEAFYDAGFQSFVLRYTVGNKCVWPLPLKDYDTAMETILENAASWQIDPNKILIAGFSAGGHLAACAITEAANRPAAAVLVYPAVLENCIDHCLENVPHPAEHITAETCPCFVIAARDDETVDIQNSLEILEALRAHHVPFESHIYSAGGHAFGIGEESPWGHALTPRLKHWVDEAIGWAKETLL